MGLGPLWLGNRRRLVVYAGIFILIIGTLHVIRGTHVVTDDILATPYLVGGEVHQEDPCASLGGLEDIFVIVRTGSNEVRQKLPPLLNTTLPCFRQYGIWSDLEEEFAGHHIANALDEIDSSLLEQHSDFEYYRHLQEQGKNTLSSEDAANWADAPNTGFGRDTPAWKLDKWKFLPVAKKAYQQNSTSKWYVFIECDTYVLWSSVLAWLSGIDASRPYYIGRQMNIGDAVFAYGGGGIFISNPAMEKLVERYTAESATYNELTINQWAGDFILSRAMLDVGIEVTPAWPTLEGERPAALDMNSRSTQGHNLGCYNAATYHHMTPDDIYAYYDFDIRWNLAKHGLPRHGDIFRQMVWPQMQDWMPNWDNLSPDVQSENATYAECKEICENQADCLQFSLTARTCKTSRGAKLGKQQLPADQSKERIDSGWVLNRVEAMMKDVEASCNKEGWIMP
ncbi:hypothetical protein NUW58_g4735 [Xylaria curta]|uniref:Uncharacterized protein n=2 Tax=Xylaria curta TaxID=42375 RepID=A0ACC1P523_9PEZI|nr:hypothetical protein NUW58_g5689 [Xylaria curta]KAJ2987020.1 hypothetical protein NUW58_g4735 [Xylaria curta]